MHRSITLSICSLVLAAGSLGAQNISSFYQVRGGGYVLYVGQTPSAVIASSNSLFKSGFRITDIDCYRDTKGVVRCDTVYNAGSGSQWIYLGQTQSQFIAVWKAQALKKMHLVDISTYKRNDGTLIYNSVYRPNTGSYLYVGLTSASLISRTTALAKINFRLSGMESYLDSNGTRRFDAFYLPGKGGYIYYIGVGITKFASVNSIASKSKYYLTTLDTYYDANNVARYCGVWRPGFPRTIFYVGQSQASFIATWKSVSGKGFRLNESHRKFLGVKPTLRRYGVGLKGRYRVPSVGLGKPAWTGQKNTLIMTNSSNRTTNAFLFLGVAPVTVPILGGRLLVNPLVTIPVTIPAGGLSLPVFTPADPTLNGSKIFLQSFQKDAWAAPSKVSMSQGVEIVHGRRD